MKGEKFIRLTPEQIKAQYPEEKVESLVEAAEKNLKELTGPFDKKDGLYPR